MSIEKSSENDEIKRVFLFCLLSLIAWRLWVQVFLWLGWLVLPLGDNFLGGGLKHFLEHPGFWAWSNFDGEHYLAIAQHGYGNYEQAFFPFYPFLVKFLAGPFKENLFVLLISSLTISHLAFFGALVVLFLLIRIDFERKVAYWAIFFLLAFPTSFFFASTYNESLFLLLILSSFYSARKKKWWIAGLLGVFASATRFVGIFLIPALLIEWWDQKKSTKLNLVPIFLISAGLFFYINYLDTTYNDPLLFIKAQPIFGAQREIDKLILPYQVIWRYLKMIFETSMSTLFFTVWLEFATTLGFFALLVFAYIKRVRRSYLVFSFLSFILPTLTGTFSSMPRYLLVSFPGFIALALIKNVFIKWTLFGASVVLLIFSTILFTRGYFVS